ncbi:MAG: hypothetical protein JSS44_10685 [Proteobacteria bacterium]|nr:hypothetical protein [Pseudomonadota bacterium]
MGKSLIVFFSCLVLLVLSQAGCTLAAQNKKPTSVVAPAVNDFTCTGPVHAQAIQLWERSARPYVTQQLQNGLNKSGNVYVLYYTQEELQSFVEMTRRCKDLQQIDELASTLNMSFAALRPLPDDPTSTGWVCTGGSTCTTTNKLLGKEVPLCSMQFLGLIGAIATNIVENVRPDRRTPAESAFLENASSTMALQVNRWLSPDYSAWVDDRLHMTPTSVKDGSAKYFYQDKDLWLKTALSDLAELQQASVNMGTAGAAALKQLQSKRDLIAKMFSLFLKRTTIESSVYGPRATLDKGYWRLYTDNRYARYNDTASPVSCNKDDQGRMIKSLRVQSTPDYIDVDMSWDISHARRLVPALDTFVRNKANITKVFGYSSNAFDPVMLQRAFANQIVDTIWNKDRTHPLFSNFWDGQNGWYRVGYDNGTGECRSGEAPYSLAWSFPTGSYPQWGAFDSTIRTLGRQLYQLVSSPEAAPFIDRYYPQLKPSSTPKEIRDIWMLTLASSLIGA